MSAPRVETWSRVGETALLALVFLAPLAASGRTWDPGALRSALVQSAALTLAASWALKGLARGRWDAASPLAVSLAPLAALAAWTVARFAAGPFREAGLPELAPALAAWLIYAAAVLELGGARHAARLAFWATAASALVAAAGASQRLRLGGAVAATLGGPEQLAAFAAVALPAALSLRLDPEATPTRRAFSLGAAAALAVLAAWAGSARGLVFFAFSALVFAASAAALLRGPAARRTAIAALACAAFAAASAAAGTGGAALVEDGAKAVAAARAGWHSALALWTERPLAGQGLGAFLARVSSGDAPDALAARALAETGAVGLLLLLWTLGAGALSGLRSAWDLRRRGALAEAGYAAAFASGFAAWAVAALAGLVPSGGAAAWLAWAAGGVAAGLAPLARPRSVVRTLPLAAGGDVRRLLEGPALIAFACLAAWPALWLRSDVVFNRALAEARAGSAEAALADAGRVWPGSPAYPSALYLRGRALMDLGKPGEALAAYDRLAAVAPDFARVHARRAEAYAALGDWGGAADERARQDRLTPLDVGNLTAWAEASRAAGDLDTARRAASRAEALAPDDRAVVTQLAANALLERRMAQRDASRKTNGRRGTAMRPRGR